MTQTECIDRFLHGRRGSASNMHTDGKIIYAEFYEGHPAAMHLPNGFFLVNEDSERWRSSGRQQYITRSVRTYAGEDRVCSCNTEEFKRYLRTDCPVILKVRRKGAKDIPQMVEDLMDMSLLPLHRFPRKRFETLIRDEVAYIQLRQAVNRGTFPPLFTLSAVGQFRFKDAYDTLIEASRRGNRDAALDLMKASLIRLRDGGVDMTIDRNMKSMARALKKGFENYYGCVVTYEICHLVLWDGQLMSVQDGGVHLIRVSELEERLSRPYARTTITPNILETIKSDLVLEEL